MEENLSEMSSSRRQYPEEINNWWNRIGAPKLVVAPMVDASELAWRSLSRRYGADLCYTPMLHSRIFTEDARYRAEHFFNSINEHDRPLIVQFCGNDPKILAKAAEFVKDYCDAVDINLGCPQTIAKRGHYGAFLQDEWELVSNIVKEIRSTVNIPVTCKIRVFDDVAKTLEYAKTIVASGCFMLTVHGRTIDQKGPFTGLADWNHIKAVREVINIPMLANGNIQYLDDAWKCIEMTGVDGVMSAEGNLHNPAIFKGINPPVWEMALEYLDFVKAFPCPLSYTRGHLFKLFHHLMVMDENDDLRQLLAKAFSVEDFYNMTCLLKQRYEHYLTGEKEIEYKLPLPPYICQPYVRPPPSLTPLPPKPPVTLDPTMSNKKKKRLLRNPRCRIGVRIPIKLCSSCVDPRSAKCDFKMCRKCCRSKCSNGHLDCVGHKWYCRSGQLKTNGSDITNNILQDQVENTGVNSMD